MWRTREPDIEGDAEEVHPMREEIFGQEPDADVRVVAWALWAEVGHRIRARERPMNIEPYEHEKGKR